MQRLTHSLVGIAGNKATGLAAPYYDGTPATETVLPDGTIERLMPGCFSEALAEIKRGANPCHCYFNHNHDKSLGSTPETLELWETKEGLHFNCDLDPDDLDAQKTIRSAKRKEFKGVSFGAFADKKSGLKYSHENGRLVRSIFKFNNLFDVSPVYVPTYSRTGFTIRSLTESLAEIDQIEAEAKQWFADQAAMEETKRRIEANKKLRR